jgi:hypothetical protein
MNGTPTPAPALATSLAGPTPPKEKRCQEPFPASSSREASDTLSVLPRWEAY